jgi:curved DNA-binding protein CbpA
VQVEVANKVANYYRILQVDPEADPDVVEAAYKRLARKYHPDLNPEPDANQRMKDINLAYETLGDPEKRAEYHEDWQHEYSRRQYEGDGFAPQWLDGIRPSVSLDPAEVRFERVQHGQTAEANVTLSLSRKGRFQGKMLPHQSWIKAKVASRRKSAVVIRVTVDTSSLRGGVTYEGSVGITSLLYGTVRIPVRLTVAPEPRPILKVDPLWLDAGSIRRSDSPITMPLNIRNAGDGEFEGEIRVKHGWLAADKDQFRGNDTLVAITLNPSALKPGRSYTGKIEVSSNGGLSIVPVKVLVKQEFPDLPPPESDEYWPAVLAFLKPESAWEKEFVAQMKALSQLRGWKPASSQQSTLTYMLARDLDKN